MEQFVSLKELARLLGVHPSNARKIALAYQVKPQRRQMPDTGTQRGLAWTREQAERIVAFRRDSGFLLPEKGHL